MFQYIKVAGGKIKDFIFKSKVGIFRTGLIAIPVVLLTLGAASSNNHTTPKELKDNLNKIIQQQLQQNLPVKPAQIIPQNSNQPAPPEFIPVPKDAVNEAVEDLDKLIKSNKLNPEDIPFIRWIWVPSLSMDDIRVVSDALNKVSREPFSKRPDVVSPQLIRIDLRWYSNVNDGSLQDYLTLWENFQFDPWFSQLITKDTLKLLSEEFKANNSINVVKRVWEWDDKKQKWTVTGRKKQSILLKDANKDSVLVRINPPHLQGTGIEKLQEETGTLAPIVHYSYLTTRLLSTIKDRDKIKNKDGTEKEVDNVYSSMWGGLYYEFAGINKSKDKNKRTDLDQLLFDLGVLDKFETLFERLQTDRKVAMFRSQVTGKPRAVVWIPTLTWGPNGALPVAFLTIDIRDRDVDIGTHAMGNLAGIQGIAAYEVIFSRRNGQNGFALYDGKQNLLDEGAIDVVTDHTVPAPFTARLQSAISCIRCHGPHNGWQPMPNDVQIVMKGKLDIFGDITNQNEAVQDTLNRLKGQYEKGSKKTLMRVIEDYATATQDATGVWPQSQVANTDAPKITATKTSDIWFYDRYQLVTAATALRELGIKPEGDPVALLNKKLPPDKRTVINGIIPEDFRFGGIKSGLGINRSDWYLFLSYGLERAQVYKDQTSANKTAKINFVGPMQNHN